jgi:hypothetical protein
VKPGDRVRLIDGATTVSVVKFRAGDTFTIVDIIGEDRWLVVRPDSGCRHCIDDSVRLMAVQVEPLDEMIEP